MTSGSQPVDSTPQLGRDGLILEGLVTTLNADGSPNISPMGPIVDPEVQRICLRPFQTSVTFQNLRRSGEGVLHVSDDVELIVRAAINKLNELPPTSVAQGVRGVVLADACRWYAFTVESIDDRRDRTEIVAEVVQRGVQRPFFGFNRAKHAVIEAAIVATRVHLLPADEIRDELARLEPLVRKTGSAAEHEAFALVDDYIDAQLNS